MKQDKKIISILLEKINAQEGIIEKQQKDFYDIEQRFLNCVGCLDTISTAEPDETGTAWTVEGLSKHAKECLIEVGIKK